MSGSTSLSYRAVAPNDSSFRSGVRSSTETRLLPSELLIADRICCCSVFCWVKFLGVLTLLLSAGMIAASFFFLNDDAYFDYQQVVTGGASGLGFLLAALLLLNAFCLHRACIYLLLACIQALVMMTVAWFTACACFVFVLFLIDCQKLTDVGYDCKTTAYAGVATSATVFLLSLVFHGFFLYVLSKASRCQKQDDGRAIP